MAPGRTTRSRSIPLLTSSQANVRAIPLHGRLSSSLAGAPFDCSGKSGTRSTSAGCPRRRFRVWVLRFIGTTSPRRHLLQPLKRVGIPAYLQHQPRRLRIRLGPACSHFSKVLSLIRSGARKHRSRTPHPFPSLADKLGIHCRKRRHFLLVAPQRQLPLAMPLHRFYTLHQLVETLPLCHYPFLLPASRAAPTST